MQDDMNQETQNRNKAVNTEQSVQEMQDDMNQETQNRNKAVNTKRVATVKNARDLIDKIIKVTHGLANSAGDSTNKQRGLDDKVGVMSGVMEQQIEQTRLAEAEQLKKIQLAQEASDRTVEQAAKWEGDMQKQVSDGAAEQEGILAGVDEEVDKTTEAAAARV